MPFINDSKDLLYVIISLCVLLFTVFSCWAIYYLARILQQTFNVIKETRDRLNKVDEIFRALKEKIEHSASYLFLIGEGIKKLVEVIKERSEKNKTAKKKKEK